MCEEYVIINITTGEQVGDEFEIFQDLDLCNRETRRLNEIQYKNGDHPIFRAISRKNFIDTQETIRKS